MANEKRNNTKIYKKGLPLKNNNSQQREFKIKQKEGFVLQRGEVLESFGNGMFQVKLEGNGVEIKATLAGKLRLNYIKILVGDRVELEMSVYDLTKGRITRRL